MGQSTSPHDNAEFLKAEKQANTIYDECYTQHYGAIPKEGEGGYSNYLQLKNTFQHSYTSAYFAYNYSPEVSKALGLAKEILTAHKEVKAHTHDWKQWLEGRGWEQAFLDGNRDMWNNIVGIEYARQGIQNSQSLDIIGQNIFNGIINGDIFIIDFKNDPRRWCGVEDFDSYWNMLLSEFLQELNNHPGNIGALALIANPDFVKELMLHSSLLPFMSLNDFGHLILEIFLQAQSTQPIVVDPILLDLNGDGVIGTTALKDGVYFDHNGDKFAEKTSWVNKDDGILVIDKNNNGVIDDGSEVFGDNYVKSNGNKASSGFDALADLDSNGDGVISAEDSEFSNIKILKGDGTLISLEEAGITSINLSSESVGSADENGNTLVSQGTFVRNDGSVGNLGDFNLIVDKMDSFAVEWLEESEEISALPEVLGSGTVYSLHQAMVRDESGVLKGLVEDFIEAVGSSEKRSILVNILYKWTGADGVADGSRGSNFDAKKLYVLEKFIGRGFVGVDGSSNPNNQACHILENAFNKLLNNIYASLMSQTELKDVFDKLEINYDYDSESVLYSLDKVREYIDSVLLNDEIKGKELLSEFSNCFVNLGLRDNSNYEEYYDYYVSKGEDYRYLLETIDKVVIRGTESDDSIEGTMGTDAVFGGLGNDTIMTRQGDDLVYGGEGDGWLLKVA